MFLEEQFRLAQQQRFGASSEGHPAQGDLFNEAEAELDVAEKECESAPVIAKKKPVRQKLPSDLPRETIIHDIEDKTCTCCGNAYITWVMSAVKSLNLFQHKSKSLSMCV